MPRILCDGHQCTNRVDIPMRFLLESLYNNIMVIYGISICYMELLGSCCFLSRLPWSCLRSVCRGEVCIKDIYDIIWDYCSIGSLLIVRPLKTHIGTLKFTNMNLPVPSVTRFPCCFSCWDDQHIPCNSELWHYDLQSVSHMGWDEFTLLRSEIPAFSCIGEKKTSIWMNGTSTNRHALAFPSRF